MQKLIDWTKVTHSQGMPRWTTLCRSVKRFIAAGFSFAVLQL
ncbi:hypothetical protein [Streptomyces sp. NPDC092295]